MLYQYDFPSRKVLSSPSIAWSRLAISKPLQSKMYAFLEAAKLLQKQGVRFMIQLLELGAWRTLICGYRSQFVAAGAIILLQEP